MHRHHLPGHDLLRGDATLENEDARHLQNVLRVRVGDRVEAFDGKGNTRVMTVAETAKRHIRLVASGEVVPHAPPARRVTLFAAAFKPSRMDWLIEKAVELGVWQIAVFATTRSVTDVREEGVARWRRIAREALRQCGGAWEPEITRDTFDGFCGKVADLTQRGGIVFFGDLTEDAPPLADGVQEFRTPGVQKNFECGWCFGPEGDFTGEEIAAMRAAGARGVSLGPRVLRSETAGIFGLCAIQLFDFESNREGELAHA